MTTRQTSELLTVRNEIVAPPAPRACVDQSFELPGGLYVAMVLMFTGFIAVLSLAFRGGHLAVVYGVIFAFIAAFFAIPAMFPAMAPSRKKALAWSTFLVRGIDTATGRSTAREATVLVLLLPFLILCFGVAVAIISTMVG